MDQKLIQCEGKIIRSVWLPVLGIQRFDIPAQLVFNISHNGLLLCSERVVYRVLFLAQCVYTVYEYTVSGVKHKVVNIINCGRQ